MVVPGVQSVWAHSCNDLENGMWGFFPFFFSFYYPGTRNFGIVGHSGVFFFSLSLQIVYRHTVKPRGGLLGLADRCAI